MKKISIHLCPVLCATLWIAHAAPVRASNLAPAGFISPVVTTFDGLGLSFIQNLPFTADGNTYNSPTQSTYYYGDLGGTGDCFGQECVGASSVQGTMVITLGTPTVRAGFYLGVSSAQVSFFDGNGNQLDTETVTPSAIDASNQWIGWEAASGAIASVTVVGLDSSHSFSIDNLTTDSSSGTVSAAPEPGSVTLAALLTVALGAGAYLRKFRSL